MNENCIELTLKRRKLLKTIETGDKTFRFQYESETKRQGVEWRSLDEEIPEKSRLMKLKIKTKIIYFTIPKKLLTKNSFHETFASRIRCFRS